MYFSVSSVISVVDYDRLWKLGAQGLSYERKLEDGPAPNPSL